MPWRRVAAHSCTTLQKTALRAPVTVTGGQQKAHDRYLWSGTFRSCDHRGSQSRQSHDHKPRPASQHLKPLRLGDAGAKGLNTHHSCLKFSVKINGLVIGSP